MLKKEISVLACFGLAALLSLPVIGASPAQAAHQACREYSTIVRIDGRDQIAYGRACLQPDGSWKRVAPAAAPPVTVTKPVVQREVVYTRKPTRASFTPPRYYRPPSRTVVYHHFGASSSSSKRPPPRRNHRHRHWRR